VTTWYDVTDLMIWPLPHLTGIQRTTVGILNGLLEQRIPVRLVAFDPRQQAFVPLSVLALPETIRRHIPTAVQAAGPTADGIGAAQATDTAPPGMLVGQNTLRRKRWLSSKGLLGTDAAATEMRNAFRQFKTAARTLRRQASRWARTRLGLRRPDGVAGVAPLPARDAGRTVPRPEVEDTGPGPFAAGDLLLSLGATWSHPAHAVAAGRLRRHGVRVARMIYDLIPTIKPQWVEEIHTRLITPWVRSVLTNSDHVFTISEFSKSEIDRYCAENHLPCAPLTVLRLGDVLQDSPTAAPLPRFVPARPFFLCVSTLDVRKNHRLLYDAWSVMAARDPDACPDLVCLGVAHLYVNDLLREIRSDRAVNGRIHVLQGIDDNELAWYYGNCVATIYPSRYEGWGLPVAESLGHGRLCLASHATSIPEISRDLPEFFDPFDAPGLVALVNRACRDPEWVREREARIRSSFVPTPWSHTVGQMMAALAQTLPAAREAA
jgi:glycosyltransferase involved in cell wall biosynthesis